MAHHLLTDTERFDLDAYLHRIGYDGPRDASLDVLRALHLSHARAIAFENLNPLLGWPVRLDTASLVQKLVIDGRGGYCFEQNLLFAHALDALGYQFDGLAARVIYTLPSGTTAPRSHMLLRIELDGTTWIADVGFGGLTMTGPIRLVNDSEQTTPHEPFRLARSSSDYVVEARLRDGWNPLYRFSLEAAYLADYEVSSWYLCHFPQSQFLNGLIAARPASDRRYALRNNVFTTHFLDGRRDRRMVASASELLDLLHGQLAIRITESPELIEVLARIAGVADPRARRHSNRV